MRLSLRALLRWLAVLGYFTITSLGHLAFTQWLLRPRENTWLGSYAVKDAVPAALVAGGLVLLAWILRTARRDPRGVWPTVWYWLLWGGALAAVDRFLTFSIYEYAHYPQYALLAWLIARALDPDRSRLCSGRVLFWTTLLGMVDEVMQYLWITPSYGNYLDFNDFLVNLLAAAAGMMLYYGGAATSPDRSRRRVERGVALGLAVLVIATMLAGRLQISPALGLAVPAGGFAAGADGLTRMYLQRAPDWYGSRQHSPHRGAYWVLSPGAGLLAMLLAGGVFARYPRPLGRQRRRGGV